MALSDEEEQALAQLLKKKKEPAKAPPSGQVWEDADGGRGATLTGEHFTTWLSKKFPDVFDSLADDEEVAGGTVSDDPEPPKASGATRLFQGKQRAG